MSPIPVQVHLVEGQGHNVLNTNTDYHFDMTMYTF